MKRWFPVALVLSTALAAPTMAQTTRAKFTQGTPVVIVGEITSEPKPELGGETMQVGIGPGKTDFILHLEGAELYGFGGERLDDNDLNERMWVRAEGFVTEDPRRIKVTRLQVIGNNLPNLRRTAFYRPGFEHGYLMQTTLPGAPQFSEGTPVVVVGKVSSPPAGALGEKKMQVAVGPQRIDYTIHFRDAELYGPGGQRVDEDAFDDGQWVRAEGWVMDDPRRIRAARVEVIGMGNEALRQSAFFRPGFEQGYIVRSDTLPVAQAPAPRLPEGTPVVVVGEITSPPAGAIDEKKMQVAVGPQRTDYTLHFADATLLNRFGQKIDEDALDDGQWVRAVGHVMDDPRRIRVDQLQVVAENRQELALTPFAGEGLEYGYIAPTTAERVAGFREAARGPMFAAAPFVLVGRVTADTGPAQATRRIRVAAAGNEWTLDVTDDALVTGPAGQRMSIHDVDEGQWIRAMGWQTGDLRMRVVRVENIGPEAAYRASGVFRASAPMGYVERVAGERQTFQPVTLQGRVIGIHPDLGFLIVQDTAGNHTRVYFDTAQILLDGRAATATDLRVGDFVTVRGRAVAFPQP